MLLLKISVKKTLRSCKILFTKNSQVFNTAKIIYLYKFQYKLSKCHKTEKKHK